MFSQDHMSILRPNPKAMPPYAVTLSPNVMLWYGAGCHDLCIRDRCNEHSNNQSELYNFIPEGLDPDKDYYNPHTYLAGSEYFKV